VNNQVALYTIAYSALVALIVFMFLLVKEIRGKHSYITCDNRRLYNDK